MAQKARSRKSGWPRRSEAFIRDKHFPVLGSPSHPPTNREKSRGREIGMRFPKRERKKVVKKRKGWRKAA